MTRPNEWPPQPGDLWADRTGREWFARHHACGDVDCRSEVELVDARGDSHHHLTPPPAELAPLTLVRRKPPVPRTAELALDCAGCGDTIWPTEHVYEVGDGRVRCVICQVRIGKSGTSAVTS